MLVNTHFPKIREANVGGRKSCKGGCLVHLPSTMSDGAESQRLGIEIYPEKAGPFLTLALAVVPDFRESEPHS